MTRVRNKTDEEQSWEDVMSKRSASYFLKVLSVLVAPLILVGLTASSGSAATATTPTFFGAKLTTQSQPSNAENGQSCDENGGIPPRFHLHLGGHQRIRERQPFHGPEDGNRQAREAGVV